MCDWHCKNYYENKKLCAFCNDDGQISMFPSVRACRRCMINNKKYIRRPILVIATDCEEVNKQMFLFLKDKIEQKPSTHSCH